MPVIEDPSPSSSSSRRHRQSFQGSGVLRGETPFLPSRFRGLGCTTSASARQVLVPEAIRASRECERRKEREEGGRRKGRVVVVNSRRKKKDGFLRKGPSGGVGGDEGINLIAGCGSGNACGVIEDAAWCGMGVGVTGEVDFVVASGGGQRDSSGGRGRSDADKICQREAMMLKARLLMTEERMRVPDHYHGWRLDVDNMSYEQLLELSDRIGYVSTGLKEDEIRRCIRKVKISNLTGLAHILSAKADKKCCICQEEYEEEDDLGKLSCGHSYHLPCIKQWLSQKNTCPVCKSDAVSRS